MRLSLSSDFLSGLLFVIFGSGFVSLSLSSNYEFGSAVNMGPGFFPIVLGTGVVLVGLALIVKAFSVARLPNSKLLCICGQP